jgi:hypothetical protein
VTSSDVGRVLLHSQKGLTKKYRLRKLLKMSVGKLAFLNRMGGDQGFKLFTDLVC